MKNQILFVILLVIVASGCNAIHKYSHPSDKQLTDEFYKQKEDFNKLAKMFAEDLKGKNLTYGWVGQKKEYSFSLERFSEQRRQDYLQLLNKLNINFVGTNYENPEIITLQVTFDSDDIENGEIETDAKGYAYSPVKSPERVIELFETDFCYCHKKIDEDWYIFHEMRKGKPEYFLKDRLRNMSKTLVLEIPDEVYLMLQKQAESKGLTIENLVLEIIFKNFSTTKGLMKLSETSFSEWDNNEDADYDKL